MSENTHPKASAIALSVYSVISNSLEAGQALGEQILERCGDKKPEFINLLPTFNHSVQDLIAGMRKVIPDTPICGCSVFGAITNEGVDHGTNTACAIAFINPELTYTPFLETIVNGDCKRTGQRIRALLEDQIAQDVNHLLFIFPDSFAINMTDLYNGLSPTHLKHVDIVGGLASNNYESKDTYQFFNDKVITGAISGFLISGEFQHSIAITHGSHPIGLEHTVTKSTSNVVYEIDNRPALEVLKEVTGDLGILEDWSAYANLACIAIPVDFEGYSQAHIIRAIQDINKEDRSFSNFVNIEEGTRFSFSIREEESVLSGIRNSAQQVYNELQAPPNAFYYYVDCDGRGSYLFGTPEPDVKALTEALPTQQELGGFFAFGEIGPHHGINLYHNFSGILIGMK